jgi:hypothetical protein
MLKKATKSAVKKTSVRSLKQTRASANKIAVRQFGKKKPAKKTIPEKDEQANPLFMPNNQKPALHRRPLLVYTK